MNNILVIGAHFDDAELGAGGAMAKWVLEGKKVYKLTLTDNVTEFSERDISVDYESSAQESSRACEILGVKEVKSISTIPCSSLVYTKNHMQEVESFIFKNKIDTVVLHFMQDINQDHVGASIISYVAARYCRRILAYQSNKYILPTSFYPRFFVDITDTVNLKKKALMSYSDEHNRFSRLFDITIQENLVLGYSALIGEDDRYVEGFDIIKYVQ